MTPPPSSSTKWAAEYFGGVELDLVERHGQSQRRNSARQRGEFQSRDMLSWTLVRAVAETRGARRVNW